MARKNNWPHQANAHVMLMAIAMGVLSVQTPVPEVVHLVAAAVAMVAAAAGASRSTHSALKRESVLKLE